MQMIGQTNATPMISIVIATLNVATELPRTLNSIRGQTFSRLECLIVDGGSTDGTVTVLHDYRDVINWGISEPDRGIYDAWNKACAHARGEWVIFLGAGDEFADAATLAQCAALLIELPPSILLAYGRQDLVSPRNRVTLESFGEPWESVCGRWEIGRPALPPHGTIFHRRSLFDSAEPFDLRFRIAADSHFLLRILLPPRASKPVFLPITTTRSPIGGVSFRLAAIGDIQREIDLINREFGLRPPVGHLIFEFFRRAIAGALGWLPQRIRGPLADGMRHLAGKPARWSVK